MLNITFATQGILLLNRIFNTLFVLIYLEVPGFIFHDQMAQLITKNYLCGLLLVLT